MATVDLSKMSIAQLEAFIAEQNELIAKAKQLKKVGISPADPVIEELASQIRFRAKEMAVPLEKFMAVLNKAVGAGKATATGGTRAVSRNSVLRADFKAAGVKPYPVGTKLEVLQAAYIAKFGQAQYDAKIAVLPLPQGKKA